MSWPRLLGLAVAGAALLVLPWFVRVYHLFLLLDAIVFALLAMSLDIVLGYAGMVSFGHAAFFGIGAYVAALSLLHLGPSIWPALLLALLAAGLYGLLVGYVATLGRGIYFAISTLIFAQIVHQIVFYTRELGSSDGLHGVPSPEILPGVASLVLDHPGKYYYFVLAVLAGASWAARRLVKSHFGRVLLAIRENEARARFLGYRVRRYKVVGFVLSAGLAGLAGAIYPGRSGFAAPEFLHWTMSGEAILMVLIGGRGTLVGPVIGAVFFVVLFDVVSSYWKSYPILIGAILILIVTYAQGGLLGVIRRLGWWRPIPSPALGPLPGPAKTPGRSLKSRATTGAGDVHG